MRLLVFDGTAEAHDDGEPFSPLFVYGQNKTAGDIAVAGCPRHYIMRSSWVIGEGHNFVKTMKGLSDRVADPENKLTQITVADDNLGRLTFTRDMAAAIFHVLDAKAPYGTTPESLIRVLTPYDVIMATESLAWIAAAVCSTCS